MWASEHKVRGVSGIAQDAAPASPSSWRKPLAIALLTTLVATLLAYALPESYAATGVGLTFLFATYWAALRRDSDGARRYALSLGGILDPEPIDLGRIASSALRALAWAALLSLLIFPAFWLGFVLWWRPGQAFLAAPASRLIDEMLGQLLVIALPEEAFFRGYLQTALDAVWRPRVRVLGAWVGPGLFVASAIFAVGHVLTEVHPNRLAVFFPALVFGWLRARTGGIGAALAFHAACNVFASFLVRSYGLAP
ncbi:MAG TPA: MrtC family glutamic-type intramembrane protease [Polyangiaceae bacterium]|nr:MrtC family glutamic-type intramembrane protease [Polyangiaceae bacterium]